MIKVNFRGNIYKFKQNQFTDFDCWYEQEYNQIEEDFNEGFVDVYEYTSLHQSLSEISESVYSKL